MNNLPILLLQPRSEDPSPVDQTLGARLAEAEGGQVQMEHDWFRQGDLEDLEKAVARWKDQVLGVVGATGVSESARLGELAVKYHLLCFVANNNPAVWQERHEIFHIGIPNRLTAAAVAGCLLGTVRAKRIFVLHDDTDFHKDLVSHTEAALRLLGAEVCCSTVHRDDCLDQIGSWKPEIVYLVCSEESLSLLLIRSLRQVLPETPLLIGTALTRRNFIGSLGPVAEGMMAIDLFRRGAPRGKPEAVFMDALSRQGVDLPTANHGFGWDGMKLCSEALLEGDGDLLRAIQYLESDIEIEGATGYFRFSPQDHNGRAVFNPTTLSRFSDGRVAPLSLRVKP